MPKLKSYQSYAAILLACVAVSCRDDRLGTPTASTRVDLFIGPYSLTVTAGSACTALPEVLRTRTYQAGIESRAADEYVITLSNAQFLADEQIGERTFIFHCSSSYGLGCNQFTASREGDALRFRLASNDQRFNDEFAGYGGMIVELLPPDDSRLGISGTGLGRVDGRTIQASLNGRVWNCPAKYTSFDKECANCDNADVAMMFTRR